MDLSLFNQEFFKAEYGFAEDAVYTPSGGASRAVRVILDSQPGSVNLGAGIEPRADRLYAIVLESSVSGIKTKDAMTVRGTSYLVMSVQSDMTGMLRVELSEVIP